METLKSFLLTEDGILCRQRIISPNHSERAGGIHSDTKRQLINRLKKVAESVSEAQSPAIDTAQLKFKATISSTNRTLCSEETSTKVIKTPPSHG
jgi:hypothetical protein